jgi:hypothetical protein
MRYEVTIMPSAKADIFEIRAWQRENTRQGRRVALELQ